MAWARAVVVAIGVAVVGLIVVSGGEKSDPRTPPALPGMPAPFLGTAVVGDGGVTAAVDAYGDVVDLRAGPAGEALIENPAERQAAGTVPADTGIVPRVAIEGGPAQPLWRADSVEQRYLARTNAVRTTARFGRVTASVTVAAALNALAVRVETTAPREVEVAVSLLVDVEPQVSCGQEARAATVALVCRLPATDPRPAAHRLDLLGGPYDPASVAEQVEMTTRAATFGDRVWLGRARPLGPGAPVWATSLYKRSLLVLRALTDRRSGAVAAGARDSWAYVWPRDAATAALAFAAAGYRDEAVRVTRFLLGLGLEEAARFRGDGSPVPGRAAQGDAVGWVAAAAQAAGLIDNDGDTARVLSSPYPAPWRERADYREGDAGDYLANAIASGAPASQIARELGTSRGLVRKEGATTGLDSAAAWAVRPFPRTVLQDDVRRTLHKLAADGTRFGIVPGEDWHGGEDPWTAPTAWSAWSLAALAAETQLGSAAARTDRDAALALLANLRRAATPAGALPERVDARTGIPRSTTPLAWPHAFAILTLLELWPRQPVGG